MWDEVIAFNAHDAVPNNDAVTPLCTFKLPVIVVTNDESTTNMFVDPVATVNSGPEILSVTVTNGPVEPLMTTTFEPDLYTLKLPVSPNEPVICADPVYGNAATATAPVTYDAVNAYDDEITLFEPYGPNTPDAVMNDAVCAVVTNDAVAACVAYDAVPVNESAVILPLTDKLPVN